MAVPDDGPATLTGVKAHLSIDDAADDEALTLIVAAVNAKVLGWPVAAPAEDVTQWSDGRVAHLVLGATMLVARLYKRRNSPDGVAAFNDAGPLYVSRNDPDVAMLLNLGVHAKPSVG